MSAPSNPIPPNALIRVYTQPDTLSPQVQSLTDLSTARILSRQGNFTAIEFAGGKRGYVQTEFVDLRQFRVLKEDKVPMHQSASLDSPVRMKLAKGILIECIGLEIEAQDVKWIGIRSPQGQSGYIRADVKLSKPSRFRWMRNLPRKVLANLIWGICLFLMGFLVTFGTYIFNYRPNGFVICLWYGPMLFGAGRIALAIQQLAIVAAIERRKQRERMMGN